MRATATEVKNNLGRYLRFIEYEDVIVTSHGKDVAVLSKFVDEPMNLKEEAAREYMADYRMSYEEFKLLTKDSEKRYELIDGRVYIMDSPLFPHQNAVLEIVTILKNWFEGKKCFPAVAPFDVTLVKSKDNTCVVQPDVIVICDKETITKEGRYKGIPALAVEILSKSTREKDLVTKLNLYARTGIGEYWVVDTDKKTVKMWSFKDNQMDFLITYHNGEILESYTFKGLSLKLSDIFI
jgi:prevent-host-death family protein